MNFDNPHPLGAQSLDSKEAADWLGIPEDTFLDLAKLGLIPPGMFISRKTRRWPFEDVLGAKLLLRHLLARREELRKLAARTAAAIPQGGGTAAERLQGRGRQEGKNNA